VKELSPAKVAVVSFLFLVVLYLTGGVDLALASVLVSAVLIFQLPSVWLFLLSFSSFALYLIFIFLNLKLDFIFDLTISSYILFAAGIILYFLQGKRKNWELIFPFKQKIDITQSDLIKIGGILLFVFLIYPLTNVYLAAIIGYITFLIVFRKSDGRYAFSVALFFLILCPFLLIAKKDKIAETAAIFTYYFLVIGTVQEIINLIRNPQEYEKEEVVEGGKDQINVSRQSERIRLLNMQPQPKATQLPKIILVGVFLVSASLIFYLAFNFLFKKPVITSPIKTLPKVTPTTVISTPVPTSSSSELKMRIQNGTLIPGLAASAEARLKTVGFKDIEIGNADRKDYKNWEIIMKKTDEKLVELLKQALGLTQLTARQATEGARFDVELIIGSKQ